jgi:hypothetical protein
MTKRTSIVVVSFFTPLILLGLFLMVFVEEKSMLKKILPFIGQLSFLALIWLNHIKVLKQSKNVNHNNSLQANDPTGP